MKNREIADIFSQMADMMEILGLDSFRVNSYRKAGRILSDLTTPIEDLAAADELQSIPGVGKSTAEKIKAYLATGQIPQFEELRKELPPNLMELLRLPGLGPKTAMKLWKEAGIESLADLAKAFEKQDERLKVVHGLGPKKIRQLWESLMFIQSTGGRTRLGEADTLIRELAASIGKAAGKGRVVPAGSYRHRRETVGDMDLLAEADDDKAAARIVQEFTRAGNVRRVTAAGPTKASVILTGNVQADLRVVESASFGSALAYFTGSKAHNVRLREIAVKKGLKLNEYGLFRGEKRLAGADEESIYKELGLPYIEPELREDAGEIEAAREGRLPALLGLGDIRSDLHMHTTASDGANTIEEMIEGCRSRGYTCMAICDHSRSEVQANGLEDDRMLQHAAAIRRAARFKDIAVLVGSEVDIHKDGYLDYPDEILAQLDFVIVSAHTALGMTDPEATDRLIKAIEHRYVNCVGHPTGRLINARPGMEIDIAKVAQAAAANGVALEINAHYMRLDLRDTHVRAAVEAGAKIAINTDAHGVDELDMMRFGVTTARRGWAQAADVINTWTPSQIRQFIARKRK